MRTSLTLLILLAGSFSISVAQISPAKFGQVNRPIPSNAHEPVINLFKPTAKETAFYIKADHALKNVVKEFSLLSLSPEYNSLQKTIANVDGFMLQLPGGPLLNLHRRVLTVPGFIIKTSDGKIIQPVRPNNNFIGTIENEQGSLVALSFDRSGVKGFLSNSNGNKIIEPLSKYGNGLHVLYDDKGQQGLDQFSCYVNETEPGEKPEDHFFAKPADISCKTVKMRIECSYALYQAHNNDINDVIDFVFSLFNASSALFKNDNINILLSEIYIWNQPDIYTGLTTTVALANALQNKMLAEYQLGQIPNVDIAQVISPLNLSGGAATGIGIINNCGKSNGMFSVAASTSIVPFPPLPAYSKGLYIFTHETGHLVGSQHTQSCTWPGGAIDNCAAPEGICQPGPPPVNGGTIMSYCNLTPYGINFSNGFGPLPAAAIRDHIERTICVSSCDDTACGNMKVRGIETIIVPASLKLKWINEAPKYRVGLKPNTTGQWQYYEVINADSFELVKTYCESLFEFTIEPWCNSLNKYGTGYHAWVGDSVAIRLRLGTGTTGLCAGDSLYLAAQPDSVFSYQWFMNGLLQPQFTTRIIFAKQPGNYHVQAIRNGCNYLSDTARIVRPPQNPRMVPLVNGLTVRFNALYSCSKIIDWDFGDGSHASVAPFIHTYAQRAVYLVTLKVWDAEGNMEQVQKYLDLRDEFIDSLDGSTQYGTATSLNYIPFACRNVAFFSRDSLNKNNNNTAIPGAALRYSLNGGNTIFETPKTGTIEFKLYPQKGLVKLRGDNTDLLVSDTGYVLNTNFNVTQEKNAFFLFFSKWGGIQVAVDSIVLGNIANGVTGPLKLNEWNNIGISYGSQGVRVMLNGSLFASDPHVIDSAHASLLGRFNFGSYIGRIGYDPFSPLYFKGFEGAIDMVRLSRRQNDFTFSTSVWQGADSVTINKQLCYGDSYQGYNATGTYYRSAVTAAGCDSITKINLVVHDLISVSDTVIHPLDAVRGSILITNVSGITGTEHYLWSTGDTTTSISNLTAGEYTLHITDSLGCEKTMHYHLFQLYSDHDYIVLFPNPVMEKGKLLLRIGTASAKKYDCIIYDVLGRKLLEQPIEINSGVTEILVKKQLLKGQYILFLKSAAKKRSFRFVVQ